MSVQTVLTDASTPAQRTNRKSLLARRRRGQEEEEEGVNNTSKSDSKSRRGGTPPSFGIVCGLHRSHALSLRHATTEQTSLRSPCTGGS